MIRSLLIAALLISALPASATPRIVRVSGKGADSAGCGAVGSLCRTMQFALTQIDAGGYIVLTEPGVYEKVAIIKSVSIVNDSQGVALIRSDTPYQGAMSVPNIGNCAKIVRLRGLTLEAPVANSWGLVVNCGDWIDLSDLNIRNSAVDGIQVLSTNVGSVSIRNTSVSDSGRFGILGQSRAGLYASGLRLTNNAGGGVSALVEWGSALITDSTIRNDQGMSAPGAAGVEFYMSYGLAQKLTISGFANGLLSRGSHISLSRSTLVGNHASASPVLSPPALFSAGDNIIRGNQDDALNAFGTISLH